MTTQRFRLQGMHCVGCAMLIDEALEALPGVQTADTSYARQVVEVSYDARQVSPAQLLAAIEAAGYRAIALPP